MTSSAAPSIERATPAPASASAVRIPQPVRPDAVVLHLLRGTEGGGIVTAIRNVAPAMIDAGWDLRFLVLSPGKAVDMLEHAGLKTDVRQLSRSQRLRGIAPLLASYRPAIVHSHNPASHVLAQRAKGQIGAKVFRLVQADMFEEMKGTQPGWKIYMWKVLMTRALRQADALACVSPHLLPILPGADRLDRKQVLIIPNGFDPTQIENDRHEIDAELAAWLGDRPMVLSMGRLVTVKNYPMLLRAFNITRQSVPEARLVLAGSGPLEADLKRLMSELRLESHVRMLPWVDHTAPLLKRADVLAISSFSEACPLVALEAMTVRTPVVGTAVGGIPFMIDDNQTGLLAPSNDHEAMGRALARVLGDAATRKRLGEAGRAALEARFHSNVIAHNMAMVYNRLLEGRRPMQDDLIN